MRFSFVIFGTIIVIVIEVSHFVMDLTGYKSAFRMHCFLLQKTIYFSLACSPSIKCVLSSVCRIKKSFHHCVIFLYFFNENPCIYAETKNKLKT